MIVYRTVLGNPLSSLVPCLRGRTASSDGDWRRHQSIALLSEPRNRLAVSPTKQ